MEPATNRKPIVTSLPIGHPLKLESSSLRNGITMILSHWIGLQMAIDNQWGGYDSFKKSEQLAYDINFFFSHSKEGVSIEDLESMLHERLLLTFNTEIEDGSIEEVAEQLITLYEEYKQGNY